MENDAVFLKNFDEIFKCVPHFRMYFYYMFHTNVFLSLRILLKKRFNLDKG